MRPLESLYASIVTNNNNSNVYMMSNNNSSSNNNNVDYLDPCTPYVSINYENGPYSKGMRIYR